LTSTVRAGKTIRVPSELSDVVKRLIAESIDSVPELEAILLLCEDRERRWTAAEAGQRLYVSTTMAAHILGLLTSRGFFEQTDDSYRYAPKSPDLDSAVRALASSYSRSLIAVTRAIHSKPGASVRQFAEAFRLRKED
jgi:hypothetical protein